MRAQLKNVRLTYDEGLTWALDGITLSIASGERLCVLGANGSGKSTLAQVLCGLEAPDEGIVELMGEVVFDGKEPHAERYRCARQHMGLVFQNPEDQIVTSIAADDVAFGPENLGIQRPEIIERVNEELARVALTERAEDDPARFSGGQQQRLAIAGALAKHGNLLVLDEPGAMLDVRGRRGIMRVLDELQASGTTLVHITHFLEEAEHADRVIVMSKGRIIADGAPAKVLNNHPLLIEAGLEIAPTAEGVPSQKANQTSSGAAPQAGSGATPLLHVEHLSFVYDKTPALADISFEVGIGRICALIGHTGSGKSTLARLICALDAPTSGSITIDGIPTTDKKRRRELRSKVGYVMQLPERQLFAETVSQDIAFGPRNLHLSKAEVKRRVTEQLSFFEIEHLKDKSPFELSGGQQRLVALAGVLAMEPKLLVLDEPTAGLDPAGAARIKGLVRRLKQNGCTILLITHDMNNVAELADDVVVLNQGGIALTGSTQEVFAQAETLHAIGLGTPSKTANSAAPKRNSEAGQEVSAC